MSKNLSEQLNEWVEQKKAIKLTRNKNRVAFLALKDDIKDALDKGHAAKTMWAYLSETGRFTCTYESFLRYINREIYQNQKPKRAATTIKKQAVGGGSTDTQKEEQQKTEPAGFVFNPVPNPEDLF